MEISGNRERKAFRYYGFQQVTAATLKSPIIDLESKVWEAIAWWKFKNKYKRPIDKDDAKALRMIQSKLISDNK